MIDSDGSVILENRIDRKKLKDSYKSYIYPYQRISLVGTRSILEDFKKFVYNNTGFFSDIHPDKSIYRIQFCSKAACKAIAKLLYRDANVFLDRKFLKAKEIIESL